MDTKIAITHTDDSLTIMSFVTIGRGSDLPFGGAWADKSRGEWIREPSAANIENEIARSSYAVPAASWRIIAEADIPRDRTYRNALRDRGSRFDWDMPTARELHRQKIRHARAAKLQQLDGEWMRATGQGKKAEADEVEAKRQALRDLPADPSIDAAATTDELKAIGMEALQL